MDEERIAVETSKVESSESQMEARSTWIEGGDPSAVTREHMGGERRESRDHRRVGTALGWYSSRAPTVRACVSSCHC